jgi:hypothetical protein
MTIRFLPPVLLMTMAAAAGLYAEAPPVRAVGYSLEVEIDPAAGRLHAVGVVRVDRTDLNTRRLEFFALLAVEKIDSRGGVPVR